MLPGRQSSRHGLRIAVGITLRGGTELGALEGPRRALEQRLPASFFQVWTRTGCRATERSTGAILLEAGAEGRTVAPARCDRDPAPLPPWPPPRGRVDPGRVAAGDRIIGHACNMPQRDRGANYLGGFDYALAESRQKPRPACLHTAIEFYRAERSASHDLLAAENRYKASLTQSQTRPHWLEIVPRWSLRHLAMTGRNNMQSTVSATHDEIARHCRTETAV